MLPLLVIYPYVHLSPIVRLKARRDHETIFSEPMAEIQAWFLHTLMHVLLNEVFVQAEGQTCTSRSLSPHFLPSTKVRLGPCVCSQ